MGSGHPAGGAVPTRHPPLFDYFKQLFAQVTNPPIDAIREEIVTSTTVYVGAERQPAGGEDRKTARCLQINNPILTETDLLKIKSYERARLQGGDGVRSAYYKNTALEQAIDRLFVDVDRAYRDGANILILSDRDMDEYHVAIPSLLAVSAV